MLQRAYTTGRTGARLPGRLAGLTGGLSQWRLAANLNLKFLRVCGLLALWYLLAGSVVAQEPAPTGGIDPIRLVAAARKQVGVTLGYDAEYRVLPYPGGDVPLSTGVCTDVITRALREQGVDLQKIVHEDMTRHFADYPHAWGLKAPDRNIDHRRVPNLMTCFQRRGWAQPVTAQAGDYHPGDVVAWNLGGGTTHVGIVADAPMVIHNIGAGTREEDSLFRFKIIGHYRLAQDR